MLAKAFVRAGVFGDASHVQRMDFLNFDGYPDDIMFRNSIPHAHVMMPIAKITGIMESFGYEVIHIVIDREDKYIALSKVRRGHQPDVETALESLPIERAHIAEQMEAMGVQPVLVQYENFIGNAAERRTLFESYSLPEPVMHFWNANDTYEQKGF
jgi:hypothetical protein